MSRGKDWISMGTHSVHLIFWLLWKTAERSGEHWTAHQNPHIYCALLVYFFIAAKECNMPNWTALIFFPAIFPCRSYCSHSLNNILHSLDLFFCRLYSFLLFPVLISSIWYGTCSYPVSVSIKESCPLNSHLIYQSASSQTPLLDPNLFNATVTDR